MLIHFILDTKNLNEPMLKTMRDTLERTKHAHYTDINMRINGEDEIRQADWLKYLVEQPK